jgi:hypothetical protein
VKKRPELKADYSPPSSTECAEFYFHAPFSLHYVVVGYRDKFTLLPYDKWVSSISFRCLCHVSFVLVKVTIRLSRVRRVGWMYDFCTYLHVRACIQKFPDWPPGARTASGTALCH